MFKRALLVLIAGLFLVGVADRRQVVVRAQSGCSVATLNGAYTYALTGSYFDQMGQEYGYSSSGRLVADGNGGFTGADTISDGATITRGRQYSGVYTVNSDCTGSAVFKDASGNVLGDLDLVITNNARNINFIQTDDGTNVAGTAQQQFPSQ